MTELDKISYLNKPLGSVVSLQSVFSRSDFLLIFDIGANDCLDSIRYSKIFPNAKIFSFEPILENCYEANNNITNYGCQNKISVFNVALGNEDKDDADFYVSFGWEYGNKSSSTLLPSKHVQVYPECKFNLSKTKVCRFDTLANTVGFNIGTEISFVHMDVQGAELKVLEGFGKHLDFVEAIYLEVANIELYKGQPIKKHIHNFLIEKGYFLFKDDIGAKYAGDQFWVKKL